MVSLAKSFRALDILHHAKDEIISLAKEVGIDGNALIANLPVPGHLWHGHSVPVLTRKYRGTCSVVLYLNQTSTGQEWPFLRFHSFKNGGETRTFNGLQWLNTNQEHAPMKSKNTPISIKVAVTNTLERLQAQARLARFRQTHQEFILGTAVSTESSWLHHRLFGEASKSLCQRIMLKQHEHKIIAKLENAVGVLTGYQTISAGVAGDQKRFVLAHSGLLKGSFFRIRPSVPDAEDAVIVCEGVATALSLALVWQGEIRAALTASNLNEVRAGVVGRVLFAHDQDVYKPKVGNVGFNAAIDAMQDCDLLVTPKFNWEDQEEQPTDFNDVLGLYGLDELYRQSRNWYQPQCVMPSHLTANALCSSMF